MRSPTFSPAIADSRVHKSLSFSSETLSAKRGGGSVSFGGGWSQGGGASVDGRVTFTW